METHNVAPYHDLIECGLKILPQSAPRMREDARALAIIMPPPQAARKRITYSKTEIDRAGSILAAQFAACGLRMPEAPDFSLPIRPEWRAKARQLIDRWDLGGKPLLIYRPIVLNKVWHCPPRSPDPAAYATLFAELRNRFFVVSFADLKPGKEWIVGPEQDVDVKFHAGELEFELLAALFAEAALVFCNAGMAPVLAQAVGTPVIVVYGGHESAKTTQASGMHLAPTLAVEPDRPCDCHPFDHPCDKHITLAPAIARINEFVARNIGSRRQPIALKSPRVLIFATTYVDDAEKAKLLRRWLKLTQHLNPDCDLLLVDSCSPLFDGTGFAPDSNGPRRAVHRFPDNIGHLSRGGRDGWGRAFCYGLQAAINGDYDYVVHIEGDSLFRLPVGPIVRQMEHAGTNAAAIPVAGTASIMPGWIETGLLFFRTKYLVESDFIGRYDWQNRTQWPAPESVIGKLLADDVR